jgi:hypothetical protein
MLKSMFAVIAAALLLGACDETPAAAPPPPPSAAPPSFMVFFDWDRSNLSAQATNTIQQAAAAYKTRGGARITATGHTDTSGPENYNMALSLRRANSVKEGLVKAGVPATAITTVGRGEAGLLVQTGDGVREPQNRRVEIVIVGGPSFPDAKTYCKALSDKWREYRTSQVGTPEAIAMSKCDAGDYMAGIPVLENGLLDAKISLPVPGYRWPGQPI